MELETLGSVLRQHRERRGLSQEALAELGGLSRGHIGEIERGVAIPSILTLHKFAAALGVTLSQIFAEYENLTRHP